ncbi:MAG: hypothetical protein KUG83_05795 [Gammaproteobacteria bacterium]|nr:hypothetical protein [Gammaproteobacteria bacterium]
MTQMAFRGTGAALKYFIFLLFFLGAEASQAELKIGGFASVGFIAGDTEIDFLSGPDVISESAMFGADNTLGLQLSADITPEIDMTVQLLAKGVAEGYDVSAHWAYISYNLSPESTVRVGKLNFPGALYNETQEIGFSYPWARNPIEVYTLLPFTSVSGTDYIYRFDAFDINWELQSAVGSVSSIQAIGATISLDLAYGFALQAYTDYGRWHFSAIKVEDADIAIPVGGTEISVNFDFVFTTLGFEQEFNDFVLISEVMKKDVKNNPSADLYSKSDMLAYYLTLGYRTGDFMLHFTYAATESDNKAVFYPAGTPLPDAPPAGIPAQYWVAPVDLLAPSNGELFLQKSYTAGLRYDLSSQVALKFEAQRIVSDKGSWGVFYKDPGDSVDLFTVVVDVVF